MSMRNIMKYLAIILLSTLICSCVSTESLKSESRFAGYLGTKELSKKSYLCSVENDALYERKIPNYEIQQTNLNDCHSGKLIAVLPEGSIVKVHDVVRTNLYSIFYTEHWFIVGRLEISGESFEFYHYLGISTDNSPPESEIRFAR